MFLHHFLAGAHLIGSFLFVVWWHVLTGQSLPNFPFYLPVSSLVHAYNFRNSWVSNRYPKKYISWLDRVVSIENDYSTAEDLQWKFEWTGIVFLKESRSPGKKSNRGRQTCKKFQQKKWELILHDHSTSGRNLWTYISIFPLFLLRFMSG